LLILIITQGETHGIRLHLTNPAYTIRNAQDVDIYQKEIEIEISLNAIIAII